MESNFEDSVTGENAPQSATPEESAVAARDALQHLDADAAKLATQVVTPFWYYPILGLGLALIVGSQALSGPIVVLPIVLGAVIMGALGTVYRARYGVSLAKPIGPRSTACLGVFILLIFAAFAASIAIESTGTSGWWPLLPIALAFIIPVILGPLYDKLLRYEIAKAGNQRA